MSGNVKTKYFDKIENFWKEFENFILTSKNFIWRGQATHIWKLESTWHRYLSGKKKEFSREELENFVKRFEVYLARGGIFPFKEKKSLDIWLKYARHYGLPSPYIDFTYSPYVALFFACQEAKVCQEEFREQEDSCKENDCFVLYMINVEEFNKQSENLLRKMFVEKAMELEIIKFTQLPDYYMKEYADRCSKDYIPHFWEFLEKNFEETADEIAMNLENDIIVKGYKKTTEKINNSLKNLAKKIFRKLFFDPFPESFNTRMIRQQGCFIYDLLNYKELGIENLEDLIKKKFSSSDSNNPILYKWLVPSEHKKKILKKLDLMNINGISLYGDEAGAVLDTKLKDDILFDIADSKIDFD